MNDMEYKEYLSRLTTPELIEEIDNTIKAAHKMVRAVNEEIILRLMQNSN